MSQTIPAQGSFLPARESGLSKFWFIASRLFIYFLKAFVWLILAVALGLLFGWLLSGGGKFDLFGSSPETVEKKASLPMSTYVEPINLVNAKILSTCHDDVERVLQQQPFLFDVGSDRLNRSGQTLARRITSLIQRCSNISIEVQGHTDNTGNEEANRVLSESRAESVMQELISNGISVSNIRMEGFGSRQPAESNDTAAGRAKNRRIEIWIYENRN